MNAPRRGQVGLATVEFAIVGATFFLLLFGVLEFGRALYVWNALNEATRRGARVAAVCPVNHSAIRSIAVFDTPGGTGESPFVHGLTTDNITLEYLDEGSNPIGDPMGNYGDIRYVRVSITDFQHTLLVPFLGVDSTMTTPGFAATLPRESLGVPAVGATPFCFGSAG
jgi:hypothetical protein